jgi:hypothetical protein
LWLQAIQRSPSTRSGRSIGSTALIDTHAATR